MAEEEKKDECCCGGQGHDHSEGGCCGGHGPEHGEGGCCGGHGPEHGEGGCCGGHGPEHGEGGCCGGHGRDRGEGGDDFDYAAHDVPLPAPTLTLITTSLAQQAMYSMGIIPDPRSGKSIFLMNQARHLIDMIQVIFDKTEGNRTEEETRMMDGALNDLRMLFVKAMDEKNRREAQKQ